MTKTMLLHTEQFFAVVAATPRVTMFVMVMKLSFPRRCFRIHCHWHFLLQSHELSQLVVRKTREQQPFPREDCFASAAAGSTANELASSSHTGSSEPQQRCEQKLHHSSAHVTAAARSPSSCWTECVINREQVFRGVIEILVKTSFAILSLS